MAIAGSGEARLPYTKRLERIERLKRLFVWPMGLWIVLMVASMLLAATRLEELEAIRDGLELAVFYSLPAILFYIVGATFYGSYRILESRGYKNLAAFLFIQFIAYFVVQVAGIEVPTFNTTLSLVLVVAVTLGLFGLMFVVQTLIRVPEGSEAGTKAEIRIPSSGLGVVMAAFVSLVIASIIHFRVRDGISFVTWGVFFGTLLSVITFSPEKSLLGLLYFLDPGGAANLFRIIAVKRELEDQQDLGDVQRELTILGKEKLKTEMSALANELDEHLTRVQFEDTRRRVQVMIDQLKGSEGRSYEEQERILQNVMRTIAQLREQESLPSLPAPDYSKLSLGEKVAQLVGLSDLEIGEAVKEDLISASQAHLWGATFQARVRQAVDDFDKEKLWGQEPIFIAKSWHTFVEANNHLLQTLTDALVSTSPLDLKPVKGAERWGLMEIQFRTITRSYSAVVKSGASSALVVVGIVEAPALTFSPEGASNG